ncbi:MAG TPA: sigma-70 family RNA polymerase sigma factor [Iamia sp.]|jgi:RNA polymerase sigma-70 factor (ECF subfamily)|nr:sigma-70 family RNA polymerase sigma factor [Iamia sp.]
MTATVEPPAGTAAEARRAELESQLDGYRRELTGYCYRMLGSSFDAEDAVQNAMVRAWRALDRFDGRSSLRTWLYRITHNVCLDMLRGKQRRALPMDLGPVSTADVHLGAPLSGETWLEPVATGRVMPADLDPAEQAVQSESIRLAFVAALQELPPKQRAVLILREVLRWPAADVAVLLDTTVAGVNSALQRARATLDADGRAAPVAVDDEGDKVLLAQYVEAFEGFDLDRLVALLHDDATHSMPPWPLWLQGPEQWKAWNLGPGKECEGSRLLPIALNGTQGFAQYRPSGPDGRHEPWAVHLLEIVDGKIANITYFVDMDHSLFPHLGLPDHPDDVAAA